VSSRAALLALLALLPACGGEPDPAADRRHDGLWRVTEIDGDPVGASDYLIRLRAGRVVGGKDGCNSWMFDLTRAPEADGTRPIISDLMGCAAVPSRAAYWRAIGNGNVVPRFGPDGSVRLRAAGSELLASPRERPPPSAGDRSLP
jgi:hypothetical protein